jgi:hypothetical protein
MTLSTKQKNEPEQVEDFTESIKSLAAYTEAVKQAKQQLELIINDHSIFMAKSTIKNGLAQVLEFYKTCFDPMQIEAAKNITKSDLMIELCIYVSKIQNLYSLDNDCLASLKQCIEAPTFKFFECFSQKINCLASAEKERQSIEAEYDDAYIETYQNFMGETIYNFNSQSHNNSISYEM